MEFEDVENSRIYKKIEGTRLDMLLIPVELLNTVQNKNI